MVCDSRQVQAGSLFVAIKGFHVDGHHFIGEAIRRGAAAVVVEANRDLPGAGSTVPGPTAVLAVDDPRLALARLACEFYDHPTRHLKLIGVTGTNGKTTTCYLIESLLKAAGTTVGVLGTISYRFADSCQAASQTTPDALTLQGLFRQMVQKGVQYCVLEVSSHALALGRVDQCTFEVGLFTNLSQDHLDFHQTMEDYFAAKLRLFTAHAVGMAVVNLDDPRGADILAHCLAPVLTYGLDPASQIQIELLRMGAEGFSGRLHTPRGAIPIRSHLLGRHNLYNVLAAAGAGVALGVELHHIGSGILSLSHVPGRFERVAGSQPFLVVVDYAHTDAALERLLSVARELARGRLLTVFGCGGDRDRGKRPLMGRAAARYSDYILVTSDNPRSEDPEQIIAEIEVGIAATEAGHRYKTIANRREAIFEAVSMARPGDVVVVAGKGHETYQIIGDQVIDFDDRLVVREALAQRGYRTGAGV